MSNNNKKSRKDKSGFSYYKLFDSAGGSASRMGINKFVNDGSFLETFKKQAERSPKKDDQTVTVENEDVKTPVARTEVDSGSVTQVTEVETTTKTPVSLDEIQLKKVPTLPFVRICTAIICFNIKIFTLFLCMSFSLINKILSIPVNCPILSK
ncbi:hypothetical protein CHUAL_009432 [Chamberlinius hualienensis]